MIAPTSRQQRNVPPFEVRADDPIPVLFRAFHQGLPRHPYTRAVHEDVDPSEEALCLSGHRLHFAPVGYVYLERRGLPSHRPDLSGYPVEHLIVQHYVAGEDVRPGAGQRKSDGLAYAPSASRHYRYLIS
ncbi:MAG: hypothetical protein ABSH25_07045 [Syntrophorhabdales bacterium]|jgi:hypothetical protein